jgi:16S rRNA pseudouridine516 synthase
MKDTLKDTLRLDKHLSQATGMPRSHALTHIRGGHVTVDGELVRDTAQHVNPAQQVILMNGQPVRASKHLVLVQHKPPGVVTSTETGAAQTVMELIPEPLRHRDLAPVGRLDRDTSGLLILTTDGALNHRLTHPKRHVDKVYVAELVRELAPNAEERLARGIILDDGPTLPAKLERLGPLTVRLTIREGRFHQVKRMMAALGSSVLQLHREQIGGLRLPEDLAIGETRELTEAELTLLVG